MRTLYYMIICLLFLMGCDDNSSKTNDLSKLATYNKENVLTAVIEIPAGTNKKIEYNKDNLKFEVDKIDGKDRIINYLPYLGNYGFIPSTLSDLEKGGDGDPLDVIVLSEAVPTGTVMQVIPIGVLKIVDEGQEDDKVIAVPKDESLRVMNVSNFETWSTDFGSTQMLLLTWYRSYDASGQSRIQGFRNEATAKQIIEKWQINIESE